MSGVVDDVTFDSAGGGADGDDGGQRPRRIAPLIVGVIAVVMVGLFVVLAGADSDSSESADSPLIGRPAPEATGVLDDGTSFDLSRRKGSWVVLNFFDPDCIPCIQEHPELVQFSEDQATIDDGAELYSVITRGEQPEIEEFFDENGGDWPAIYSEFDEFPVAFGVAQVPETWIIDPNGFVRRRYISTVTAEQLGTTIQAMREGGA